MRSDQISPTASGSQRSASDALETCLTRIADRDGDIQAWQFIDPDAVRAVAKQRDLTPADRRGPLHGLPIGVKDNFDTHDMPTGYGSRIYEGGHPRSDAAAVALLRENGAIVVGKTVSTEFAGWPAARTRNPRDVTRTPGGSSSGSAAAVADGMIPVALGTQTLGSVIRPASFCGVVGFKPSFGRISRAGLKPLAESLDTIGMIADSIERAEQVYRSLTGTPHTTRLRRAPRLAFARINWDAADPDARAAIEGFVAKLQKDGIAVADMQIPAFTDLTHHARIVQDYELWRGLAFERTQRFSGLSPAFQARMGEAAAIPFEDYVRALEAGESGRQSIAEQLADYDAVLTLATPGEAPRDLGFTGNPAMNSAWTLLHAPCITIPVLKGASGMPIGLQITAPRGRDDDALRAAYWLDDFSRQS